MRDAIDIWRRGPTNFAATIDARFPITKIIHQDQDNIGLALTPGRSQGRWH